MIKQIVVCDKCGKEITEDVKSLNGLDFCPDCYVLLCDVIQQWIDDDAVEELEEIAEEPVGSEEEPEHFIDPLEEDVQKYPAKKKKQVEKKGKIDWDKACALKKAGWTNKEIAEECKIKPSTVGVEIYKKVKEYDARLKEEEEQRKKAVSNPWKE